MTECDHVHLKTDIEVRPDGLLSGKTTVTCKDCGEVLYDDTKGRIPTNPHDPNSSTVGR